MLGVDINEEEQNHLSYHLYADDCDCFPCGWSSDPTRGHNEYDQLTTTESTTRAWIRTHAIT